MRYKPRTIEHEGLDPYLDRTAEEHNGFGGQAFRTMVKAGVNISNLCRAMNVKSRETVKHWISLLK